MSLVLIITQKAACQRPFAQFASEVEFFNGLSCELKMLKLIF